MKHFAIAFLVTPLILAALLYFLFAAFGQNLPSPQTMREVEPSVSTRLVDMDGRTIDEFFVEDRVLLRLPQMPRDFVAAILASEDRQFYDHWGLNPISILRAFVADVAKHRIAQGASTITQQLARNLFLDHRRTLLRKIREAILALRIERSFGKDEILELYINQIYFGEGAYGLQAAARRFFGVSAADLTLSQCALLAALPKNPARFSPRRYPDAALNQRNVVLRAMVETGAIEDWQYQQAAAEPLGVTSGSEPGSRAGAYFSELVRQELTQRHGASEVYHGGLRVETTLDMDLQRVAEAALETHLREMEQTHRYPLRRDEVRALLPPGAEMPPDLVLPLRLQGAVIAIEPASGAIRALIGGRDFGESEWNRAVQAPRQAASAFKPFIYAEAIRQGYRPTDLLLDAPVRFSVPGARDSIWEPQNFDREFLGPVPLALALAKSINVPTARLLNDVGIDNVVNLAEAMGLSRQLPAVISLATGTGEVTLIDMATAYGVFANNGMRVQPYAINRVLDRRGRVLETHQPESDQVLDARQSYITTSMMRAVLDVGTGANARSDYGFYAPAAGKTGTNDNYTDAWFIGFTPDLVVGVWVGFDIQIPIGDSQTGTGSKAALPVWAAVMNSAVRKYGTHDFSVPDGLTTSMICLESGQIATPDCPSKVQIAFLRDTEPTNYCTLHGYGGGRERDDRYDRGVRSRTNW